jgi:hypothetical protein
MKFIILALATMAAALPQYPYGMLKNLIEGNEEDTN